MRTQERDPITIRIDSDVSEAMERMKIRNRTAFFMTCARDRLGLPEREDYIKSLREEEK